MSLHPHRKLARALDLVLEYEVQFVELLHVLKLYLIQLLRQIA